jgi:hypothetical protein
MIRQGGPQDQEPDGKSDRFRRQFFPVNSERAVWFLARISRDSCRHHGRGQRMITASAETVKYAG